MLNINIGVSYCLIPRNSELPDLFLWDLLCILLCVILPGIEFPVLAEMRKSKGDVHIQGQGSIRPFLEAMHSPYYSVS